MRGLWRRIIELTRPGAVDRDVSQEMADHIQMRVDEHMRAGLDPAEALRRTRMELGGPLAAREAVADERTGFAIEQLWRE